MNMKIKKFDVVELNNGNRATILDIQKNSYLVEIVNPYGISLGNKEVDNNDINKIIFQK